MYTHTKRDNDNRVGGGGGGSGWLERVCTVIVYQNNFGKLALNTITTEVKGKRKEFLL